MKILIVASSFPRWQGDWAGVFLLNLGRALVEIGHDVMVLAPHIGGTPKRETMCGVEVFRFRYAWPEGLETLAYGQGMINNVRKNPLRFLLIVPFVVAQSIHLRRMAKGADIVNAHWLIPQGIAAVLARVRFVLTLHGSDVNIRFRGAFGLLMRSLFRLVVRRAEAVTANSTATKERIETLAPGVDVKVIPMGVDIELFSRAVGGRGGELAKGKRGRGRTKQG
ncbi:MAG: glycosyltransferase [Deltaproteobacteria bacterium]|uniref:Glycosyltransferase n=1 Tax=Candidatus Zymogenus saltonus TaxID=2844893 RepID=A0A9D8KE95_9DELT|nr:glycosyltransferase [Candidatus Zymogenus saltonus]